jgi:hypothetical protein
LKLKRTAWLVPMMAVGLGQAEAQSNGSDCFSDAALVSHFALMYAARVVGCQSFPEIAPKYRGAPMSVNVLPYKTDTAECRQLATDMSWREIRKAEADRAGYCALAIKLKHNPAK